MTDIKHTCAFTGHRPKRLTEPERKVITWLEQKINEAVAEGYTDFITGTQRGVDIWAAEIVLRLRETNSNIVLVAASAFEGRALFYESEPTTLGIPRRFFDLLGGTPNMEVEFEGREVLFLG